MPKKPRKIRIGSSAWTQQKARDRAAYDEQKAAEKPKYKPKQQSTYWQSQQQSHQESHQQSQQQSQKPKPHYEEQRQPPIFQSAATIANLRTLGLTAKQNTLVEIKHAYRILALKYHPDKNKDPSALGIMKNINLAFAHLIGKDSD